ncbi:MAG TPA: lamin tail domain-containing protein [Verrucomicrobiae bacterium]|nr:lamin tail domain-containing protein [Verrucomicrobiae bacterium]
MRLAFLYCFLAVSTVHAQLRITEFMASNASTLADEDGSYEDWIEIQNNSPIAVNLLDWSLTDDDGDLTKWRFPATNLPPGQFLIVFASDKNRRNPGAPLHTNFKLGADGEYLALVDPMGTIVTQFAPEFPAQVTGVSYGLASVASNVTLVATGATAQVLVPSIANGGSVLNYNWTGATTNEPFNASSWSSGATGVGFGTADVGLNVQASMLNNNASAFMRLPFVLSDPTNVSLLTLRLKYDDGFVAGINGVELARANAPVEDLDWNSVATAGHGAGTFESMSLGVPTNMLRAGTNILAIQGLNVAATDTSFLILPELIGTMIAGESTSGLYFTQPTPGTENLGGATMPGPGIANVTHTPYLPLDNDNLVITAKVFATANPLASVTLFYRVMFVSEVGVPMFDDGLHGDGAAGDGVYGATIPASASTNGQMVRYYIRAQDNVGNVSRLPVFTDPASTAQYFGTVVNPNYVASALPVVHLFAPATVLQPGPTTTQTGADSNAGGRISLYFDGEFYDNVFMFLRGNTTAGYNKKSHRIRFNDEHKFRNRETGERLKNTSFVADYPDPTYMRQGLSYWLCNEIGASGPLYAPYRLQLNGQFYQLANHNDVHGEELLERLGYDPNGALYNAAGTIQPGGSSTGGFEKKTRRWEGNTDYVQLANAISESLTVAQRRTNIFDRLDLPQVISYMVAARFVHENDDVWANMSIYHDNDGDDLWRIIPFDMNLSWGAAFMDSAEYSGIQATNDNLKSFPLYGSSQAIPSSGGGNWNRLYDVIFSVPQTREMFLRRMRTVLDEYVKAPGTVTSNTPVYQKVVAWRNLIATDASFDRAWWGWPGKGGQCNFDPGINLANGVTSLLTDFLDNRRRHFYGKHSVTNTALPTGIHKSTKAGIPLAQPTNAVLSIVAWDYNPLSGNQDHEYVQLTNSNNYAVDISDWEMNGGIYFKFKKGTVVPANSSIYVSPNVRSFRSRTTGPRGGQALFVVGPYEGHLNAWGESLVLNDAAGRGVTTNTFTGNPSLAQRYLRVTEIMYNPSPLPAVNGDAQQFEYIELKNISTDTSLNLAGVRFTNGIYFNFSGSAVTSLAPGQTVLVVRNQAAFTARFGPGFSIAGQYSGALNNGGELLRLEDAVGEKILEFEYNNSWYPLTDGLGFSLVIVDANAPWDSWGQKSSWRASTLNGSPGITDPLPLAIAPIVVSEVLTHTDFPQLDSVELHNPTGTNVNIGGWFLTDDFYAPKKYRIPTNTIIPPNGYLVFNENQFNVGANAFRFNEHGEFVYLFSGDSATNLSGYVHGYEFGEAPNGVSFGRYTNSQGDVQFVLQRAITLGTNNAYPRVGPVVMSEIMYRPPDTNGSNNDLDEFIELQNITVTNVPLYSVAAPTNTWRLRNAVDFDFPSSQTLAAGARLLVVGFHPTNTTQLAAFRSRYGVSNTVPIFGPWSGTLNNSGETIELKQPDTPDEATGFVPFIMIDKVAYRRDAPWPAGADGIGNSLQRVNHAGFGNDPTNWFAAGITAGRATLPNVAPAVLILSPASGQVINGSNLLVSVTADDPDGSVTLVELFANDALIGQWSATTTNFNWMGVSSGTYELRARAVDNLGAVSVSTNVSITMLAPPPVVTLLSPTDNAVVVSGATTNLSATATSGGGSAALVNYFVDGNLIGGVSEPFVLPWTAGSPGYHTISAIAYDNLGQPSSAVSNVVFVQAVAINPVLIAASSEWRYLDNGVDQGTSWLQPLLVDTTWKTGAAKFGFNNNGNSGIATVLSYGPDSGNRYRTYYFRRPFVIPTLSGMTNLLLEVQRDDGVALYLNGANLYRNNLPAGTLTYSQLATNATDNGNTWQSAMLPLTGLVVGTNLLAAEVHQSSASSSDSAFDLRLTLLGYNLGPALLVQLTNASVAAGGNVTFTVTATGSAPLSYRWYFNNVAQSSVTNSLTIANAQASDVGNYYVVVSNTIGVVTSRVATLTLASADTDGDGMPDEWELANGTNPGANDGGADPDGDGHSNLREYWAGTSPTNAASALRFNSVSSVAANLVFTFDAVSNRGYTVQTQSVLSGAWQKWVDINAVATNRTLSLTNGVSGTNRFYRLVTPLQP